MLEEFITSAIIIDDKEEEITELVRFLDEKDIWVKHYSPTKLDDISNSFNNRKLIFLDLFLDESKGEIENIGLIRKYLKKIISSNFGTYGIVLWTKHEEYFQLFKTKLFEERNPFELPIFVISLDKMKYIQKNNYEDVLSDLEAKLRNDVASSFFIEWNKSVKKGSDNTITTLYNLFSNIEEKDKYLESMLLKLALNYTGAPQEIKQDYNLIQKDLVKSLMDTLQHEITNSYNKVDDLFKRKNNFTFVKAPDIFPKLNSMLLLDTQNLSQENPIPGNIYVKVKNNKKDKDYFNSLLKEKLKKQGPEINYLIVLEVTPPCDFSQAKKNKHSRIIQGIILDYDKDIENKFKKERFYNISPILIDEKPKTIIFDFYRLQTISENQLSKKEKYQIKMKTKNALFADILQKLSSHMARLGVAILKP